MLVKGQPRPDRPAAIGLAESQAISIGRESGECDVMLDSAAFPRLISRLHCRLAAKENEVVLQDCSVNGCSVDGALIARRAVLSEGSTIVFGPRGSLTEFTYRLQRTSSPTDEGTTAAGGDEGARKRARAKEPAPLSEEPAPPAEPHQLAEPAQPAQPAQPSQEPRPDGSQGAGSSQPLGLGPDELNGVMLEELQCCVCRELLCRPHALPCSHTFCGVCIFQWARREFSCPICREPLAPSPPLLVRAPARRPSSNPARTPTQPEPWP